MEEFDGLNFRQFEENDVNLFFQIFKKAFDRDTQIHLNEQEGGPDGYENGEFLKKWYLHKDTKAFGVFKDGKPVGGINVWINENNENFLGNTFVDPDFQEKGIGLIIWKYIENKFIKTKVWKTETPGFSTRNHHFYVNKCGFKIYKIMNPKDKRESSYLLEKIM
jgi:GNAT superfamily N-acetyltransferase